MQYDCGKGKSIKTVRNPVKKKVLARKNVFVHVFVEKKVIQCSYKYSASVATNTVPKVEQCACVRSFSIR